MLMTQAAFARRRGVGKPAVTGWKKAGHLVMQLDERGRELVNVERSEARLAAKVDPTRGRPTAAMNAGMDLQSASASEADDGERGPGVAAVRAEVAREDLIGKRLKNARDAGELVLRQAAEQQCVQLARAVRERVQAWLRGAADRMASERDGRQIVTWGSAELDQLFATLADQVEQDALEELVEEVEADAERAAA